MSRQVFIKKSPFIEDTKLEREEEEGNWNHSRELIYLPPSSNHIGPRLHRLPFPVLLANFPWWPEPNVMRHTARPFLPDP